MKEWCALHVFLYSYGIDEVTTTNLAIHLLSLKAVMSDVNMDYTLDMRREGYASRRSQRPSKTTIDRT